MTFNICYTCNSPPGAIKPKCVRLDQQHQRQLSGNYVCQCPLGELVSSHERRDNELERRQAHASLASRRAGLAELLAGHLAAAAAGRDKSQFVARRQHQARRNTSSTGSNRSKTTTTTTTGQYFELGGELELDAKLSVLLSGSGFAPDWPQLKCRKQQPEPAPAEMCPQTTSSAAISAGRLANATVAGANSPSDVARRQLRPPLATAATDDGGGQVETATQKEPADCQNIQAAGGYLQLAPLLANNVRPIIIVIQSICFLVTLILMIILVRVRESRVSICGAICISGSLCRGLAVSPSRRLAGPPKPEPKPKPKPEPKSHGPRMRMRMRTSRDLNRTNQVERRPGSAWPPAERPAPPPQAINLSQPFERAQLQASDFSRY